MKQSIEQSVFELNRISNTLTTNKNRNYNRLFELYYSTNISHFSAGLKKCIPDIDLQYEHRYIRKSDKIWIETSLSRLYCANNQKLQGILLAKNQCIKKAIDTYQEQYDEISPILKERIAIKTNAFKVKSQQSAFIVKKQKRFTLNPSKMRKQSFVLQTLNSQPSNFQDYDRSPQRKSVSSKKVFRIKQLRSNLDQIVNNTRYIQKLQRVKLSSTFTEFFFNPKTPNPETEKLDQFDKKYINRLKVISDIRRNFKTSKELTKSDHNFQQQNQKAHSFLGFQMKKNDQYKPKSKCRGRIPKILLNF